MNAPNPKVCNFTLTYSPIQLERFLLGSSLNPGTRLQPIKVDNLVHITSEQVTGDRVDPYISEVPKSVQSLSWSINEGVGPDSNLIKSPDLNYVQVYSLDQMQQKLTDESYWNDYFEIDGNSTIAPNGCLYQVSSKKKNKVISIGLKDDRSDLLLGYGILFTVEIKGQKTKYFCRIDPLVSIRSTDAGTIS